MTDIWCSWPGDLEVRVEFTDEDLARLGSDLADEAVGVALGDGLVGAVGQIGREADGDTRYVFCVVEGRVVRLLGWVFGFEIQNSGCWNGTGYAPERLRHVGELW